MNSSLNLVFCGTPKFAVPSLEELNKAFNVPLVVTQPDKPRGRGMQSSASPVKCRVLDLGLPLMQPPKIKNNDELRDRLLQVRPDAIIVVGYGRIIPQWMLDLPRFGNINLHASLLPKYRGAAPIQWAIARGEQVTGVSTMRIDAGLDTGDILQQQEVPIAYEDTAETLAPRLAAIGAQLLISTLRGLEAGTIKPRPQDNSKATLAPILRKEDGRIDFQRTAQESVNRLRGFQPWPGAFTTLRAKNLQVLKAAAVSRSIPPGNLLVENNGVFAGCAQGTALELLELQPEGKKRMTWRDFVNGYHPVSGETLGKELAA